MVRSFDSPQAEARFFEAYDKVLGQWPVQVEPLDLVSQFGTTRVNACGPDDAPSLVLLPGGGATSTVWFGNVEALSRDHRIYGGGVGGRDQHAGGCEQRSAGMPPQRPAGRCFPCRTCRHPDSNVPAAPVPAATGNNPSAGKLTYAGRSNQEWAH